MNKKLLISALLVFTSASNVFASQDDVTTPVSTPSSTPAQTGFAKFKKAAGSFVNGTINAKDKAVNFGKGAVNFGKNNATVENALVLWALNNKFNLATKANNAAKSAYGQLPKSVQSLIAVAANKASVVTTPVANGLNKVLNVVDKGVNKVAQVFGTTGENLKAHASTAILTAKVLEVTNDKAKAKQKDAENKFKLLAENNIFVGKDVNGNQALWTRIDDNFVQATVTVEAKTPRTNTLA